MQEFMRDVGRRLARRAGVRADSIAARIPPSPLGGLEDWTTAGPEDWKSLGRIGRIVGSGGLENWMIRRIGGIGGIGRIGWIGRIWAIIRIGSIERTRMIGGIGKIGRIEDQEDW